MNELIASLSRVKNQRIVLVTLVSIVYGVSLKNGFVWDDKIYFIGNPVYKSFNLHAILLSLANGVEYLPLRDITYALDYLVWGENPLGFHLTNLLLFAVIILLAHHFAAIIEGRFAKLKSRSSSSFLPFAIAAGFAIHPINAEAVNFITCRNVLVSTPFVFLSSICMSRFLENKSFKMVLAAFAAFILAMFGKATAIMLPLLFLLFFPILFPGQLKRLSSALLPFFVAAFGFFIFFKSIAEKAGVTNTESIGFTFERKIAIALQIPVFYLKKLILPYGFSAEYATGFSSTILSFNVVVSAASIVAIVATLTIWRKKYPQFTAGAIWFFVSLFPVLNFFNTHPLVADRYLFLPAFGFMLVTASSIDLIRHERVKLLVCISIGLLLSGISFARSQDWRSDETLWKANISNSPDEPKAYANLAAIYFNNRQEQKAIDFLSATSHHPWLVVYRHYYEGRRCFDKNELEEAKKWFEKALDGVSGFVSALSFMGKIAEKEGDYSTAIQFYTRALTSEQSDSLFDHPFVIERLKLLKSGSPAQYLAELKQRTRKNPADLVAHKELALILDQDGSYEEALEHYLALDNGGVKGWQVYHNIANCYFNMNRDDYAVGYYEKAVALGSTSEDTYNNLGIAYRKLSKYKSSIEILQAAIKKFPNDPYPAFSLGVTYYDSGEKKKAKSNFMEVERKFPEYKSRIAPYLLKLSE